MNIERLADGKWLMELFIDEEHPPRRLATDKPLEVVLEVIEFLAGNKCGYNPNECYSQKGVLEGVLRGAILRTGLSPENLKK